MADDVLVVERAGRCEAQVAPHFELLQQVLVSDGRQVRRLPPVGLGQRHPGLDPVTPLQEVVNAQLDALAGKHLVVAVAAGR